MRYLYLVFEPDAALADIEQAWAGCADRLLFAAQLEPGATPAALAVVEAPDLNAAILMASRCPAALSATIEVRPLEPRPKESPR